MFSICIIVLQRTSYMCVDGLYRRLSGGLLYLCHEDGSSPGREAWGLAGGGSRAACCSWWQEGVEVLHSRVCKIRYLSSVLLGKSIHVTSFFVSRTVIVFPYG